MNVLVINAGSSSLKYQLLNPETGDCMAKGLCERIGLDGLFTYKPLVEGKEGVKAVSIPMPTHSEAIEATLNALMDPVNGVIGSIDEIDAVGHRMLHGGEKFSAPVLLTEEVLSTVEECIPLAPLHNPANITGVRACAKVLGDKVPQVGVFDTAFHQTMPRKAFMYAIPYEYYEKDHLRRYGAHGTSHRYVTKRCAEILGRNDLKIVSCHLGNGSSLAAVDSGKCVDTSMGLTPLAGLPMGTRSGDIDGGILEFIMTKYNMDIKEAVNMLNKKSGMLALSGVSSDFRDLEDGAKNGNDRCAMALEVFEYSVRKMIGEYAAAMGGVDAIVFTAGVGENGISTRAHCLEGLEFLGVKVDPEKNNVRGKEQIISTDDSKVTAMVIPTNEELMIALDTMDVVKSL